MYILDITKFRELFPYFTDDITYPDATITMNWETSSLYISNEDYGWINGTQREHMLYLMTAHITALYDIINTGSNTLLTTSSTIDKISVTTTPPVVKSQFQYWLSLTAYGLQLLALLKANAAGGMYVGGMAERSAFRKVGGIF